MRHFVAFDASHLLFAHYRLPAANDLATAFAATSLVWFATFAGLVLFLLINPVRTTPRRISVLIAIQFALGCAFALLPIAIDSDQYAYAEYGYIAMTGNPYEPAPLTRSAPAADQQIAKHWGNPPPPDPYGGGWTALNALLLAPFLNDSVWIQALVLRGIALLAACATTLLVAVVLRRQTLGAVVAFALNPLVFLEVANGAHNDIFLVLFGCAAAFFALRDRFALASIFIALATAVKFAYAPFLAPLVAFTYARTRSIVEAVLCFAAFAAVLAAVTQPFGWLHGPLMVPLRVVEHAHGTFARLGPLASAALVVAVLAITVECARGRFSTRLPIVIGLLLLALPGKIEAWYPLMTAPLLVIPSIETRSAFLAFSALGIVLAQASFLGRFPLIEAFAAALATALICAALFSTRTARSVPLWPSRKNSV